MKNTLTMIMTVLVAATTPVVAFSDHTKITLTSGQTYCQDRTYINRSDNSVTVSFSGRGVLSFDLYCEYGAGVHAREGSKSVVKLLSWDVWESHKIYFDGTGSRDIRFEGMSDSYYSSGKGYVRNIKWQLGATLSVEEIYSYADNNDGTVSINGHKAGVHGDVMLPSVLNGKTVTSVKRYALGDCDAITSIRIPASITNIEAAAAFPDYFTTLTVVDNHTVFHSSSNILIDDRGKAIVSAYQEQLTESSHLTLPSEIREIGADAFYGKVPSCASIIVPEGVTNICSRAFGGCWGVTTIKLPSTLEHIGAEAFLAVDSDDDNTWSYSIPVDTATLSSLCAVDSDYGWRYSPLQGGDDDYYGSDIFCYTSGVRVAIPISGVLTVKDGVQKIGHYALTEVAPIYKIPASVKNVSSTLFFGHGTYYFDGDAPMYEDTAHGYYDSVGGIIYVTPSAKGWNAPGLWNGIPTRFEGAVSFDLELNPNGGECDVSTIAVVNGQNYPTLPPARKVGYKFAGWSTSPNSGAAITSSMIVGECRTLYARWENFQDGEILSETIDGQTWTGCVSDGKIRLTDVTPKAVGSIEIPVKIYGVSVFMLDVSFGGATTNIVVPACVSCLGEGVFGSCTDSLVTFLGECPDGYLSSGIGYCRFVVLPPEDDPAIETYPHATDLVSENFQFESSTSFVIHFDGGDCTQWQCSVPSSYYYYRPDWFRPVIQTIDGELIFPRKEDYSILLGSSGGGTWDQIIVRVSGNYSGGLVAMSHPAVRGCAPQYDPTDWTYNGWWRTYGATEGYFRPTENCRRGDVIALYGNDEWGTDGSKSWIDSWDFGWQTGTYAQFLHGVYYYQIPSRYDPIYSPDAQFFCYSFTFGGQSYKALPDQDTVGVEFDLGDHAISPMSYQMRRPLWDSLLDPWVDDWVKYDPMASGGNYNCEQKYAGWEVEPGWQFSGWLIKKGKLQWYDWEQGVTYDFVAGDVLECVSYYSMEYEVDNDHPWKLYDETVAGLQAQYEPIQYSIEYKNYPEELGLILPSGYSVTNRVDLPNVSDFSLASQGGTQKYRFVGWFIDGEKVVKIPDDVFWDVVVEFRAIPYVKSGVVAPVITEYDGAGHSPLVSDTCPTNATVTYSFVENGVYQNCLSLTNVCCETPIWIRMESDGYAPLVLQTYVTIQPRSITNCTIFATNVVYAAGSSPTLIIAVTDQGLDKELQYGVDYGYSVVTNGVLGESTITVVGQGNYCGESVITIPYQKQISATAISMSGSSFYYDGNPICPAITINDDDLGYGLVQERDYLVSYESNVSKGTATATITGVGRYTGVVKLPFEIVYRKISVNGYEWYYAVSDDVVELQSDKSVRAYNQATMSGVVIVPDTIDGMPVCGIPSRLFEDCDNVSAIVLGTNVNWVGKSAFTGCSNLADIIFNGETPMSEEDVFGDASVQPRIWLGDLWGDESYFGRDIVKCPMISANPSTGVQSGRTSIKLSYDSIDDVTLLRYTKDGSDPTVASSLYSQKFSVTVNGLTTVKAAVFVQGVRIGKVYVFQYAPTLTEIFDANELLTLSTSAPITYNTGSRSWQIDSVDTGFDGTPSMRSCENIQDDEESWLSASFSGAGVFEFSWMSSCEWDDEANGEEPIFDHGYCTLDGEVVAWIDGETSWTNVVVEVLTGGNHEIRWVYDKDSSDDDEYGYENCIRVDCVKFTYPITASFDGNGAKGQVPENITSAPGYSFVLPSPDGLALSKHSFSGWRYDGTVYDAGDEVVSAPADMVFEAVWSEKHLTAPTIAVAAEYDEESTTVVLSSAENVSIYYTVDGSDPTSESTKYVGPFAVVGSATIKAVAIDADWFDSIVASAETRRTWTTLDDCLNAEGFALATGGDRNWIGDSAKGCVKSVELATGETSWLTATFEGAGVVEWLYRSPTNGWMRQIAVFENEGQHEIRWEGSELWVASLKYTPAAWASFVSEGDVIGELPEPICSAPGYEIRMPSFDSFSREKYTFDGWTDGVVKYHPDGIYSMTGNVSFAAVWNPNQVQTPKIKVASFYDAEKTTVKIIVWGHHGNIYYTLDGSTPTRESLVYAGEFEVAGSYTIKAMSVCDNYFDSDVAEASTVRAPWTINECLNNTNLVFSMGGDTNWTRCVDASADGYCMQSGGMEDGQEAWIDASVTGSGVLNFSCKVSSEGYYRGKPLDYIDCRVDDAPVFVLAGITDWTNVTVKVSGDGEHTIRWRYFKDGFQDPVVCDDCAWLDRVTWIPSSSDAIPELGEEATPQDVAAALAGSADARLSECITNSASYNDYRDWAESVRSADGSSLAGQQSVKDSPNAWLSFALHTDKLIAEPPVQGDLKIDDITPGAGDGGFELTVSIEGVEIGSKASKENLKRVLGAEGTTSLGDVPFSAENVDLDFGTPVGGKVKCTVVPTDKTAGAFFMKMKMK